MLLAGMGPMFVRAQVLSSAEGSGLDNPVPAGGSMPSIIEVAPDVIVTNSTSEEVWAVVSGSTEIGEVWCIVTPPDYEEGQVLEPVYLTMNTATKHYEALVSLGCHFGSYTVTYYAVDVADRAAVPVQATVYLVVPDLYEVDDSLAEAGYFPVFETQWHNFHSSTDEDWVRFYACTSYVYQIDTLHTNQPIDTALDLYYLFPDGSVSNVVLKQDLHGTNFGEQITFTPEWNGFYYVQVSSGNTSLWGAYSSYLLMIMMQGVGGNVMIVCAVDKSSPPTYALEGAQCLLNGGSTIDFKGDPTVSYSGLSPGIYTVTVSAVDGYLPAEDPDQPDQPDNPESQLYGNPKVIQMVEGKSACVLFQFIPVLQADLNVRDGWTGEWLAGAEIQFTATSGILEGDVADGYPHNAAWRTPWVTGEDGYVADGIILPNADWDLSITCDQYETMKVSGALADLSRGAAVDLGTLWLEPVDENDNQLADAWEENYAWTDVPKGDNDEDGDGLSNRDEQLAGTDPTDADSKFSLEPIVHFSEELTWAVMPGRVYRISEKSNLTDRVWTCVSGPWTAQTGQASAQWEIEDNPSGYHFLRLELLNPTQDP